MGLNPPHVVSLVEAEHTLPQARYLRKKIDVCSMQLEGAEELGASSSILISVFATTTLYLVESCSLLACTELSLVL